LNYYFVDTSVLTKRYLIEAGTTWIRSITAPSSGNAILIAQITQVELVSAAARRARSGAFPPRTAHAIRLLVDRHVEREYISIGLNTDIIQRAENLSEIYFLRAYDAVQLASAIESEQRVQATASTSITFVCADKRLLNAAIAEGINTDDPSLHP
jgi:hypothetical protein